MFFVTHTHVDMSSSLTPISSSLINVNVYLNFCDSIRAFCSIDYFPKGNKLINFWAAPNSS